MIEMYRKSVESISDPIDRRLYAAQILMRAYLTPPPVDWDLALDAVATCISEHCDRYQKKAAKLILIWFFGKRQANSIIEPAAVVTDRNDPLVKRWRKKVLERDKAECKHCGSKIDLQVHHISCWASDPVNRIKVDNGITLCGRCHAKEHAGERAFNLLFGVDN